MNFLVVPVRGQNKRLYHGSVVTVRNRGHGWGWGANGTTKGRVYSIRFEERTVLVHYKDHEYWYSLDEIKDVHSGSSITKRDFTGRTYKVFLGSIVRVGEQMHGFSSFVGEVREIDFDARRVLVLRHTWTGPPEAWYPVAQIRSVVFEM